MNTNGNKTETVLVGDNKDKINVSGERKTEIWLDLFYM